MGKITVGDDPVALGNTRKIHGQYVVEYHQSARPQGEVLTASSSTPRFTKQSRSPRQAAWASADLWHKRLGHLGQAALSHVGRQALGVKLRGPSTAQCQECAMAKITRQISRRPDSNKSTKPYHRVHIDWFDLQEGWDGYQHDGKLVRRCVLTICKATGMTLSYFTTCSKEDENIPIVRDAVNWLHLRHNLAVSLVRSDGEMDREKTKEWLRKRGIDFEKCAPDTHEQNGVAEKRWVE
jgi:hypothetical protein